MAEEQKKPKEVKSFDDLKGKINKQKTVDTTQIIQQIATRQLLERDYNEDLVDVVFETSPGTKRKVQARKPTQKQMLMIMRLSAEAAIYETRLTDKKAIDKMTAIYGELNNLAAQLCVDKKLDAEFWSDKTSNTTLSSFVGELIRISQQGPMSSDELESFR